MPAVDNPRNLKMSSQLSEFTLISLYQIARIYQRIYHYNKFPSNVVFVIHEKDLENLTS